MKRGKFDGHTYTFDDFGIRDEPYVVKYHEKFDSWPILMLRTVTNIPVRAGRSFRNVKFFVDSLFQVDGVENGKVHEYNIVAHYETRDTIVITPPFMIKNFCIWSDERLGSKIAPDDPFKIDTKPKPPVDSFESIIRRRQKEALYRLDLALII